jgi:hypothetical protein
MPGFKSIYTKGINQDISPENYPQGAYFDLSCGRIINDATNSNGNISTIKGNKLIEPADLTGVTFPTRAELLADASGDKAFFTKEAIEDGNARSDFFDDVIDRLTPATSGMIDWETVYPIGSCAIKDDIIIFTSVEKAPNESLAIWKLTPIIGNDTGSEVIINDERYYLHIVYISTSTNTEWYPVPNGVKIEAVGYYETDRIQNTYFTDSIDLFGKLNVAEEEVFLKESSLIEVIPECKNTPMDFIDINSNGQLKTGYIQYAYRYSILNGQQTIFSLPTPLIHLTDSDEKATDAGRQYRGTNRLITDIDDNSIIETTEPKLSNKSVTIQLADPDTRYSNIEIISIYYDQLNSNPVITSVYQGEFSGQLRFTDFGNTILNTYTLNQYRLFNIDFVPKTLAIKDNILFAGNIREKYFESEAWDSFETRAFRFNSSGVMRAYKDFDQTTSSTQDDQIIVGLLGSTFSNVRKIEGGLVTSGLPIEDYQDYNAVNRFNNLNLAPDQSNPGNYDFMYQSDGTTIGGEGPNLKYKFITKELIIDEKLYDITDTTTAGGTTYRLHEAVDPATSSPNNHIIDTKTNTDEIGMGPSSYASPYNSAYYKQYKRNEIYRFALVVFDKKGIPSTPKWIGDIRTPIVGTNGLGGTTSNDFEIVEISGGTSDTEAVVITANALGIDFAVDFNGSSLEDEISGYAIVRCPRDADRINLGQGLLNTLRSSATTSYVGADDGGQPTTYERLAANINHLYVTSGVIDPDPTSGLLAWAYNEYTNYEWMSPEASFNNNLKIFNGGFIQPMGVSERQGTTASQDLSSSATWSNSTFFRRWNTAGSAGDTCQLNKTITSTTTPYTQIGKQLFPTFSTLYSDINVTGTPTIYTDLLSKQTSIADGALIASGGNYFNESNKLVAWAGDVANGIKTICAQSLYLKLDTIPINTLNATDYQYLLLCDYIKPGIPFGGVSYNARQLNTYQFCDNYIRISEHVDDQYFSDIPVFREGAALALLTGKAVFGGDTFIGMYQHVRMTLPREESLRMIPTVGDFTSYTNVVSFPCESTVNVNLRHDSYIPTYSDEFNINLFAEPRQPANATVACYTGDIIQLEDLYLYNTVFSKSEGVYISQSVSTIETLGREFNSRVLASQKKFIGESIDSWTKFGSNEFIDLDTSSGELSKLMTHKDHVYAFQENGVSRLAINEKSTVQDDTGQSIVLGTGGVLPYTTYISKDSGTSYKWSVISTPETIYYYDNNNNTINYISNNNGGISDVKGLFSFFSGLDFYDDSGNALLTGVDAVYNHKYRETEMAFQFTTDGESEISSQAFVVRFNDKLKGFTSVTHLVGNNYSVPYMYFPGNKLILSTPREDGLVPTDKLYVEDVGEQNTFYGYYTPLKLTLLINPFKDRVTILDSLEFNSKVVDTTVSDIFDKIIQDETITSIRAYDDLHDTGTIDLTTNNSRNRRWITRKIRKWRYNYFRDIRSMNRRDSRLRNYFFMVELTFDSSALTSNPASPRYFEIGNINSYFRDIRTTQL